jgi:methyl-accepting chemotaxis protein
MHSCAARIHLRPESTSRASADDYTSPRETNSIGEEMNRFTARCDRIIGETGQCADEMRNAAERISLSAERTSTTRDHYSKDAELMSLMTDHFSPVADRMSTIAEAR